MSNIIISTLVSLIFIALVVTLFISLVTALFTLGQAIAEIFMSLFD